MHSGDYYVKIVLIMANANYCSNCGVRLSPGSNFCSSCGHNLAAKEVQARETAEKIPEKNKSQVKSKPESKEQEKLKKNIRSAGTSSQVLAWLLVVIFPLLELLDFGNQDNYALLALYSLLILPVSVYLIISGNRIKSINRKLSAVFILNILITVLCLGGIITLIVLFDLIRGLTSYRKLKSMNLGPGDAGKSRGALVQVLFLIGVFIAGAGIILASVQNYYASNSKLTPQIRATFMQQCITEATANVSHDKAERYCGCAYTTLEAARGIEYIANGSEATDADISLVQNQCSYTVN